MEQSLIALERAMEIQLFLQIDSAYSSCIEGARIAWPVYCPKVLLATPHLMKMLGVSLRKQQIRNLRNENQNDSYGDDPVIDAGVCRTGSRL